MGFIVLVFAAVCYVLEFVRPVTPRPPIASWVWRVWSLNLLQVPVVFATALVWRALADSDSLFALSSRCSPGVAGVVGYLAYSFVFYWWHRARHASDFIWRTLHQIHHSPRRLELVTAFYKHPLETLANALLAAVLLFPVLGLDTTAAVAATVLAALADLFYHSNIRTPDWLGVVIQRPEMHRLHHERGRHEGNYGDLPVWDWLFGTLRLPNDATPACGFEPALEERLVEMMRFADVHQEPPPAVREVAPLSPASQTSTIKSPS